MNHHSTSVNKAQAVIMSQCCRRSESVQPFLYGEGSMRRMIKLTAEEESIAKKHLHGLSDLENPHVLSAKIGDHSKWS